MIRSELSSRKVLPAGLAVLGLFLIAVGALADVLGLGGEPGVGVKQVLLIAVGSALAVGGFVLTTARGQRYIRDWRLPPDEPETLSSVIWLLLVVGILAGLADTALSFSAVRFGRVGRHWWWMAPLSYVAFLSIPGFALGLAARARRPRASSLRIVTFTYSFLAFVGLLAFFRPELHFIAGLLLAAGIARMVSLLATRHRVATRALARFACLPLVAVVTGLGLGLPLVGAVRERGRVAQIAKPDEGSPNVLLIILDTVRAANMSLYGYGRATTPFLERFARQGVTFDAAIAPAPWTLPSHASFFTGRFPHELSAGLRSPLDATWPTLAEVLASEGYLTAGFVANREYGGIHTGLNRGFLHYDVDIVSASEILGSTSLGRLLADQGWLRRLFQDPAQERGMVSRPQPLGRKGALTVRSEFLRWMDRQEDRPFFVFLNFFDAHDPYLPPEPYDRMFAGDDEPLPPRDSLRAPWLQTTSIRQLTDMYDGALAFLDHEIESLFDELEARDLLENTLVIIASDHGEEFGEHGLLTHGRTLYRPVLHVPLVIRLPGRVPAGLRIAEPVGLRDLPATVMDLAGRADAGFPGRSLARLWDGAYPRGEEAEPVVAEARGREWLARRIPVSRGDMRTLFMDDLQYILNGDGVEELYDTGPDPWELADRADEPASERVLQILRARLAAVGGVPGSGRRPQERPR